MGETDISKLLSSIVNYEHDPDVEVGAKWDPQSIQRLINDVMAMHMDPPVLKHRKELRGRGIRVVFYLDQGKNWGDSAPKDEQMDEIQEWCVNADCGKRISFDTFYFKNEEAYLMFSLRWQ